VSFWILAMFLTSKDLAMVFNVPLGNVFKILKSEFLDNCEHKSKAVV
jgi:hypothetical protein